MGLTNVCESWSGRLRGIVQSAHDYRTALLVMAALSLPALLFLHRRGWGAHAARS